MQRRVIAAVAAVLLAGIGAVMLYSYVSTADARAMANQAPTAVLVVTKTIPADTPADNIGPYVETRQLPKAAIIPGALTSISDVTGRVTATQLEVGEQLLDSRFVKPGVTTTGEVEVPNDMQTLTIQLDPMRAVGSSIVAGDKLGVYVSAEVDDEIRTTLLLRDVLVVRVQGAPDPSTVEGGAAPSGDVTLTVALKPADAIKLIWAGEHTKMWLALEPREGDHKSTPTVTVKQVF